MNGSRLNLPGAGGALLDRLLSRPAAYGRISGWLRGGWRAEYVRRYVRPSAGNRILDLGCGIADILDHLPSDVDYVGVDASEKYIAYARSRHGGRGRFHCARIDRSMAASFEGFDVVMANGVLHHLDDTAAGDLFTIARAALAREGRLVTIDGCLAEDQSPLVRFLLAHDRGKFVRFRAGYEGLARTAFGDVRASVHHNLIRIPYTHLIMVCHP